MSENDFPLDYFAWKLFLGEVWFYNADNVSGLQFDDKIPQTCYFGFMANG